MQYEVTIGIPVYNVESFIRSALESALAQTFKSIEFLVVDDCSTDSSMKIVQEYQANHRRGSDIHILCQQQNLGVSKARNRIIDEAQGRFLFFMDSDDCIEPDTISLLMEHQQRVDADIIIGSSDKIETYNNNRVVDIIKYPQCDLLGEDKLASYAFRQYGALQTNIWNFCVDINVLRRSGLRFVDINYWEDMVFMFDLVTYCSRAVLIPQITYHYLCRYESLSNYQQREQIKKDEILRIVFAVNIMKQQSMRLKLKPYYPQCHYCVMMTSFYVVCNIIKNRGKIIPDVSSSELKQIMKSNESFLGIMSFEKHMVKNLCLYCIGLLPSSLMTIIVYLIGKIKRLV